jgi:hypothetical protein
MVIAKKFQSVTNDEIPETKNVSAKKGLAPSLPLLRIAYGTSASQECGNVTDILGQSICDPRKVRVHELNMYVIAHASLIIWLLENMKPGVHVFT